MSLTPKGEAQNKHYQMLKDIVETRWPSKLTTMADMKQRAIEIADDGYEAGKAEAQGTLTELGRVAAFAAFFIEHGCYRVWHVPLSDPGSGRESGFVPPPYVKVTWYMRESFSLGQGHVQLGREWGDTRVFSYHECTMEIAQRVHSQWSDLMASISKSIREHNERRSTDEPRL